MTKRNVISTLLRGSTSLTAILAVGGLALAHPAYAQDAAGQAADTSQEEGANAPTAGADEPVVPVANVNEGSAAEEIVVTGSLFRRTNTETASPVTVLSDETLARRGITNVADAVRSISADSSGSIPTAFSGGFGSGAAAPSLRGLSVNSTLTIIDGLRTVNYPLADDGQRAFVDLNTIPRVAIDRIEVLKDGASSTYGADAIGGVVNILMRKQFTGVSATAEAGISERGDGDSTRFSLLGGFGDIDAQGWNAYFGAEYEKNGFIGTKDRGFPFNTADLSSIGGHDDDANLLVSGITGTPLVVRRATQSDPTNPLSGAVVPGATYLLVNPAHCLAIGGTVYTHPTSGATACEENLLGEYGTIQPELTRWGVTGRASLQVGSDAEAYVMGSYYQSKVWTLGIPSAPRSANPINTLNIVLPALLENGQLNPNNPYAAEGFAAQLFYRFADIPRSFSTTSDVIRGAAGIAGEFGDGWTYSFDVTGVHSELDLLHKGALNRQALIDAINEGTYNFVNPHLNSDQIRATLSPDVHTRAKSELYLAQGVVTKELFELPGGPLQLGVGGQVRRETLDQPNQNANNETIGLNAYSASGKRTVSATFVEVSAPILDQLEVQASGRYDHYSTGFDSFSPKIGAKFTPIRELAIRGTYSRGFRAPSFAESTEGSVIGYTTTNPGTRQIVCEQHGGTYNNGTCTGGSPYTSSYSIGFNSAANPDLRPEKSESFTAGVVVQPLRWLSFTADYYNIKKTDVIAGGPLSGEAIAAYYAGQPLPEGYTVTLNPIDPLFPNGIRTIAIVNAPYQNASSLKMSGVDLAALLQVPLAEGVRFSSQIEATMIIDYKYRPSDESEEVDYVGTQGPYIISSGAGTPEWRGNWSNSLSIGPATLTATAYYTDGYKSVAEDQNGPGATSCDDALYDPAFCYTDEFVTVDLVGSYDVNENFTFYFNVLNLFDAKAPINPANYAALNYNPTYTQQGAVGRFFRVGANIKF